MLQLSKIGIKLSILFTDQQSKPSLFLADDEEQNVEDQAFLLGISEVSSFLLNVTNLPDVSDDESSEASEDVKNECLTTSQEFNEVESEDNEDENKISSKTTDDTPLVRLEHVFKVCPLQRNRLFGTAAYVCTISF